MWSQEWSSVYINRLWNWTLNVKKRHLFLQLPFFLNWAVRWESLSRLLYLEARKICNVGYYSARSLKKINKKTTFALSSRDPRITDWYYKHLFEGFFSTMYAVFIEWIKSSKHLPFVFLFWGLLFRIAVTLQSILCYFRLESWQAGVLASSVKKKHGRRSSCRTL